MADYLPLISRAVSSLDKNTGENRRVLYERARGALLHQLRSVQPALEESDVTRERLALEDAIRKIEAEAAMRQRTEVAGEAAAPPSIMDKGLRGFRETVADAEDLGAAAAAANRSAHEFYVAMPGNGAREAAAGHYFEPPDAAPEPQQRHDAPFAPAPPPRDEALPPAPPPRYEDDEPVYSRPVRSYGRAIKWILLLLVLAGLAGGAYWQRHAIMTLVASYRSAPAPKPRQAAESASRPKIADRIGPAAGTPAPANAPAAAVAQKVVLYDEDPSDPKGKRYVGSALWRTETVSPGPGLAPELAIRADVEIPERHMRMTWSLRRNTAKALPASHTIEIMFTLPADFSEGGIA
ncbi:MAG: hypothetical protein ACREB8_16115, partial [Pseudolabrys sp.]